MSSEKRTGTPYQDPNASRIRPQPHLLLNDRAPVAKGLAGHCRAAQCDGGLCFTSTEGKSFPGFDRPLTQGQIVCSCPITVANPAAKLGYQIARPYPCQKSFLRYCNSSSANKKTGSTIYVGAPTGTARFLARRPQWHRSAPQRVPFPARMKSRTSEAPLASSHARSQRGEGAAG